MSVGASTLSILLRSLPVRIIIVCHIWIRYHHSLKWSSISIISPNRSCDASDSAYSYTFLRNVVDLSLCMSDTWLSYSWRCLNRSTHYDAILAGGLVLWDEVPDPREGRFWVELPAKARNCFRKMIAYGLPRSSIDHYFCFSPNQFDFCFSSTVLLSAFFLAVVAWCQFAIGLCIQSFISCKKSIFPGQATLSRLVATASRHHLRSAASHQLVVPSYRLSSNGRRAFLSSVRRHGTHCPNICVILFTPSPSFDD